jgi:hypothetical protein
MSDWQPLQLRIFRTALTPNAVRELDGLDPERLRFVRQQLTHLERSLDSVDPRATYSNVADALGPVLRQRYRNVQVLRHQDGMASFDVWLTPTLAMHALVVPKLQGAEWLFSVESVTELEQSVTGTYVRGHYRRGRPRRSTARRTTVWAARLAGSRRSHLEREWAAVLAGSPEDGVRLSSRRQLLLAVGFIVAAGRMRLHDLAVPVWRPIDWVLRVQSRTNGFITCVVGAQAIYIADHGGLAVLVTDVWEPCGGASLALYALSKWLRQVRGIELATLRREPDEQ